MPAGAFYGSALGGQGQAVDLHDIIQHARKYLHDPAKPVPVELRRAAERRRHELRQVDGPQQATAVRRQALFSTGIGGAYAFTEPVVVHLIVTIDEDKAGLTVVIGGGHNGVPEIAGVETLVDLAGHPARGVGDIWFGQRPFAPDHGGGIPQVHLLRQHLFFRERERQRPEFIPLHGAHEFLRDQQRLVELPQPAGFALGMYKLQYVRMAYVKRRHLRAAAAAGGADGKAHAVVDIHERHRSGGMRPGTGDIGAPGPQGGKLITDAATRLQCRAGLVQLAEDVIYGILYGPGDRAVDGGRRQAIGLGAGIGQDAPGGQRTPFQGPEEFPVIMFARLCIAFQVRQGPGDAPQGIVNGLVQHLAGRRFQPVLPVPDVQGRRLQGHRHARCGLLML